MQVETESELAERLKLNPATLRNWRSRRLGPPFVRIGALIRYPVVEVDAWLRASIAPGVTPPIASSPQ